MSADPRATSSTGPTPRAASALDAPRVPSGADRAGPRRGRPGLLAELLALPGTVLVVVRGGELVARGHDLARFTTDDPAVAGVVAGAAAAADDVVRWIDLGRVGGVDAVALVVEGGDLGPVVAREDGDGVGVDGPARDDATPPVWRGLRDLLPNLGPDDAALALPAVALVAWHRTHPRCPRCGTPTRVADAGWLRRCPADGSEHHPRTDPAVIMAVLDADDRLLLGHAARWPEGRYSTLAGFVEPGETLEDAVRREVAEEVGVPVGEVTYLGSQPWPFPASLMLGFVARASAVDVRVDGVEVTHARWFTRAELAAAVDDGTVALPGSASIARALIEHWYGAGLPGGW
ncbi:NAD+ diphosphatase [Sediminihabitans luteus]|uniref:NAD(+) diphosphatase n=1 Tax=Sediminihabitans luteus TaxID=1138585 RepID=A0A2M9CYW6_9CELL|nr:NAD(+) diphosphatase [Sediminihabitans luteus]PJJ77100.1 NAD+ diphosphatase [Sediminihabitans luteus]GIJ00381.1 hypothetical protein Slu03_27580 [Sediminihabitans luteus]